MGNVDETNPHALEVVMKSYPSGQIPGGVRNKGNLRREFEKNLKLIYIVGDTEVSAHTEAIILAPKPGVSTRTKIESELLVFQSFLKVIKVMGMDKEKISPY